MSCLTSFIFTAPPPPPHVVQVPGCPHPLQPIPIVDRSSWSHHFTTTPGVPPSAGRLLPWRPAGVRVWHVPVHCGRHSSPQRTGLLRGGHSRVCVTPPPPSLLSLAVPVIALCCVHPPLIVCVCSITCTQYILYHCCTNCTHSNLCLVCRY